MFKRTGTCNLCGECCGYPRSTDGGQNNPWRKDLPESVRNWDQDVLKTEFPLFNLTGHPDHGGKKYGRKDIYGKRCFWIWIPKHGLCQDKTPHGNISTYDQRCSFLSVKLPDGTVPCLLYGTIDHYIWEKLCQPTPPENMSTKEKVDNWFKNCPSCSYEYVEE